MSDIPADIHDDRLWDFHCTAIRLADGKYRVRCTGTVSGDYQERTGYHPLWELIRILGNPKESHRD